jgi:GNAT superfamily N-acetyltransferase
VIAGRVGGDGPLAVSRRAVLIPEQRVPQSPEWHGAGSGAVQPLALAKREPVDTGRPPAAGKIARLAAVPPVRRRGAGSLLLRRPGELARVRGEGAVGLHAQVGAAGLHATRSLVAEGPGFDEAGLRHRRMRLAFSAEQCTDPAADGAAHDPDYR